MSAISSQADLFAVTEEAADPAVSIAPAPGRDEERSYRPLVGAALKPFAINLKSNARWMKHFLHGGK